MRVANTQGYHVTTVRRVVARPGTYGLGAVRGNQYGSTEPLRHYDLQGGGAMKRTLSTFALTLGLGASFLACESPAERINAAYEAEAQTWDAAATAMDAQAEMFIQVAKGFFLLEAWETTSQQLENVSDSRQNASEYREKASEARGKAAQGREVTGDARSRALDLWELATQARELSSSIQEGVIAELPESKVASQACERTAEMAEIAARAWEQVAE